MSKLNSESVNSAHYCRFVHETKGVFKSTKRNISSCLAHVSTKADVSN